MAGWCPHVGALSGICAPMASSMKAWLGLLLASALPSGAVGPLVMGLSSPLFLACLSLVGRFTGG